MPETVKTAATPSKLKPGRDLPFEAQLWMDADTLHDNMDAAEYKHVVLGLVFHKYVSDAFDAHQAGLSSAEQQKQVLTPKQQVGTVRLASMGQHGGD